MALRASSVGAVVAGIYSAAVAAAIAWAIANEGGASLGFIIPYFATMPLSFALVYVLPGYVALAVAGILQAAFLYFAARWIACRALGRSN
jgi:cadmium resistance protein CadD (predicted permease)